MLTAHREQLGLTQTVYGNRLGVSQSYLSLLEQNKRKVSNSLRAKLEQEFGANPLNLPLLLSAEELDDDTLANSLGALHYPGFAHLKNAPKLNPAVLLLECLRKANLDVRVLEGLPWLLNFYRRLNHEWLLREAKLRNLQNRLGFLATISNEVRPRPQFVAFLRELEAARLASEQTLCNDKMPTNLRKWMREQRSENARHWNLLTTLNAASASRWFGARTHRASD